VTSDDRRALHHALRLRIRRGETREELIDELTAAMLASRADGREREEDILLDALDWLAGWTGPGNGL
jgi:hypothetical protein